MPSRDADLLLDDIKTAHARIERYVSGLGRAEYLQDEKTIDAAVRNLEIIGEAVRWLPQQFKEQHTSVPWSQIAGLRNRHRARLLRSFQKKTNELVQRHIGAVMAEPEKSFLTIDRATIETIKQREEGKATKVINLIKSIQKAAEENSNDPFLVALAERAKAVQESFEDRQTSTEDALTELLKHIERNDQRKKDQAAKGLDGLTYFVLCKLTEDGIPNPEQASKKIAEAFGRYANWQRSEAELREVRKEVTFAIFAQEDDVTKVTATVEALFALLRKGFRQ